MCKICKMCAEDSLSWAMYVTIMYITVMQYSYKLIS